MVQDFSRNQDAFAGIKCMMDDRVAGFDKVRHSAGRCIEGMLFGDSICHIVGHVENSVYCRKPDFFV